MPEKQRRQPVHPAGEASSRGLERIDPGKGAVETFGGKLFVRWDPEAAVTAFGPLSYFIFRDWLKNQSPDPLFLPLPLLDNRRI